MKDNRKISVIFEAVLSGFTRDVKEAAKVTLEIGDAGEKASKKAGKGVDELDDKLGKLSKTLKTLALGYIGKKLFNMGKENIAFFSEFQDEMKAVHTLLPDLTEAGLGEMSKQAKQFAKDMRVLPEHVTPALYDAISSGVPDVEAFDFLGDAQKAARAGRTDLATSVDFLTNVINSYGSEVISATEASDAMFIGMRNGKISFDAMAAYMYSIVPDAAELGIEFNNIAAAAGRMGAMGTPIAQATTQLGAFVRELSNTESSAGDIFYQATSKTLRQFIAEGNNIQDVIMVMDAAAKQLNVEVSTLFGSKEASKVVTSLAKVRETFANDLHEIQNSSGATEEAYEKMNGTLSAVFDSIRAKIAVFKLDVAEKYLPEVMDAAIKVDETLDRLDENGSLDRLGQSIGNIVGTIILEFDKWLNNIDGIIEKIDSLASFIENRLPLAIDTVKLLGKAFIAVKIINFISDIKSAAEAIGLLTKAQKALNIAMSLNPILGIIALIILLIYWIYKLTDGFEDFEDLGTKALLSVKLMFWKLVEKIVWGVDIITSTLAFLLGDIPLIGTAFKAMASVTGEALAGIRDNINDTMDKIDELNNKKIKVPKPDLNMPGITPGGSSPWRPDLFDPKNLGLGDSFAHGGSSPWHPDMMPLESDKDESGFADPNIGKIDSGKSSNTKKSKAKTIHDRIREIDDKHSPDIDLYESRADLAEVKGEDREVRKNRRSIVDVLRKQASDLLNLERSSSGQNVKIVEAARNKILLKIEETLKDINEGVNQLVGDFNIPSELKALTEYQYKIEKADNKLTKRLVYSPNVDMYLTIADTEGKGISQVKQEMEGFTGAIFDDKNDLVTRFMRDVTRN